MIAVHESSRIHESRHALRRNAAEGPSLHACSPSPFVHSSIRAYSWSARPGPMIADPPVTRWAMSAVHESSRIHEWRRAPRSNGAEGRSPHACRSPSVHSSIRVYLWTARPGPMTSDPRVKRRGNDRRPRILANTRMTPCPTQHGRRGAQPSYVQPLGIRVCAATLDSRSVQSIRHRRRLARYSCIRGHSWTARPGRVLPPGFRRGGP